MSLIVPWPYQLLFASTLPWLYPCPYWSIPCPKPWIMSPRFACATVGVVALLAAAIPIYLNVRLNNNLRQLTAILSIQYYDEALTIDPTDKDVLKARRIAIANLNQTSGYSNANLKALYNKGLKLVSLGNYTQSYSILWWGFDYRSNWQRRTKS